MKVSIIIPVYNAERYLEHAINSALMQPETAEVILIEDGSTDNSYRLCQSLAQQHAPVRLLRHPNGENRGAGASRNVGIINAKYDFISFLDADDLYTPNHFTTACNLLRNKTVDGVYGATGIHYEDEKCQNEWLYKRGINSELTTLSKYISPNALFKHLLLHTHGHFTTDAITIKRRIFSKTGLFDEHLRLHQDTAMWLKMAAIGTLIPGDIKTPIAIRRVHGHNRISKIATDYSTSSELLYNTILEWAQRNKLPNEQINLINYKIWKNNFFNYSVYKYKKRDAMIKGEKFSLLHKASFFSRQILNHPNLIRPSMFMRLLYEIVQEKK
ncbi:glycosyltransferase family 2 protein [Desulfogranum marinum]|uniref:glycosyltransferase family 2 protein n=1 Tax=Desulfogranum marinum TaxID=453220 RepID=UPI00196363D1|nr:glycosyltransferase family 2 protein [Desulfogranum marinum]MBM9513275.1 glycosyltransferase family 2 protein [Desulfogranum marinum]